MAFAAAITAKQTKDDPNLSGVRKLSEANAENHAGAREMMTNKGIFPEKQEPTEDIKAVQQRLEKQRAKLTRSRD